MVWSPVLDGWLPAHEIPEVGAPALAPTPAPVEPRPAFTAEDDAPTVQENPIPGAPPGATEPWTAAPAPAPAPVEPRAQPQPVYAAPPAPAKKGWILVAAGAVGGAVIVAAVGGVALYFFRSETQPAPVPVVASVASASASSSAAAPKSDVDPTCSAGAAKELAKAVVGRVNLDTLSLDPGRFGLGFAVGKSGARALVLDAQSLDVKHTVVHRSRAPIVGVFLKPNGDGIELDADLESKELTGPRTVAGKFTLGMTAGGVARRVGAHDPELVWPGGEGEATIPRVDSLAGVGHFVTLRRGGLRGKISAGWLDPSGNKQTELEQPAIEAQAVGTPSAAVSATGGLLLVAARAGDSAPWQVFAGRAKPGEVPKQLTALALGDAATSRISPTATPFAAEWLLQWTEGAEGSHVVKAQVLAADLTPRGKPVSVSPSGSDAGQGTLWTDGTHLVSLFLVSTGPSHALWGAPLSCK